MFIEEAAMRNIFIFLYNAFFAFFWFIEALQNASKINRKFKKDPFYLNAYNPVPKHFALLSFFGIFFLILSISFGVLILYKTPLQFVETLLELSVSIYIVLGVFHKAYEIKILEELGSFSKHIEHVVSTQQPPIVQLEDSWQTRKAG